MEILSILRDSGDGRRGEEGDKTWENGFVVMRVTYMYACQAVEVDDNILEPLLLATFCVHTGG